jgi:hypothetical protein
MLVQKFTILQFFFYKSILNLLKPRGVNTAKADGTMTAQSEKSIICKKPRLTALHAGIVLTPPLGQALKKTVHFVYINTPSHPTSYPGSFLHPTYNPGKS